MTTRPTQAHPATTSRPARRPTSWRRSPTGSGKDADLEEQQGALLQLDARVRAGECNRSQTPADVLESLAGIPGRR